MPPKVSLLIKRKSGTACVPQVKSEEHTKVQETLQETVQSHLPVTTQFQRKKTENTQTVEVDGITVIKRSHNKFNFYLEEHSFFEEERPKSKKTSSTPPPAPIIRDDITEEEREEQLDKLETRRYKLSKKLERHPDDRDIRGELDDVNKALGALKRTDVNSKVDNNQRALQRIETDFKKSKKRLETRDFTRAIDLTAPKEDCDPDVTTTIWKQSKSVFKDSRYRDITEDHARKFEKRMRNMVKPMPKDMVSEMRERNTDNLKKISISKHHPELLKYGKYDPSSYSGLALI